MKTQFYIRQFGTDTYYSSGYDTEESFNKGIAEAFRFQSREDAVEFLKREAEKLTDSVFDFKAVEIVEVFAFPYKNIF